MIKIQIFFLIFIFVFNILYSQDSQSIPQPFLSPSQELQADSKNEGYGIDEIRKKQKLIRQKSGQYLGIGIGGVQIKKDYQDVSIVNVPVIFMLKGGTQTFFNKNIGIRGFFGLDMGTGILNYNFQKDPTNSFYAMISLGIDVLAEFPLSSSYKYFLGFFGGIGGGATIYADNKNFALIKHSLYAAGIILEGGMTLDLATNHRIELGAKILPTAKALLNNNRFETTLMPYVMYNYKF